MWKKPQAHYLAGRGGKLPPQEQQVKGAEDFELVTWLVIKGEEH